MRTRNVRTPVGRSIKETNYYMSKEDFYDCRVEVFLTFMHAIMLIPISRNNLILIFAD